MSKLLAVFGAPGQQGGSVISTVLADSDLSKQYEIRAITRTSTKFAAQALKSKGAALKGAHTVFIVITTSYGAGEKVAEIVQGNQIADTATATGAEYLIFSSTSPTRKISGKNVDFCDAKAEIEDYICGLKVKSAFTAPGFFMENFGGISKQRATDEPGVYQILDILNNDTRVPLLDTTADTGKFIAPVLANPDKFKGRVLYGATKLYSFDAIAQAISNATGEEGCV